MRNPEADCDRVEFRVTEIQARCVALDEVRLWYRLSSKREHSGGKINAGYPCSQTDQLGRHIAMSAAQIERLDARLDRDSRNNMRYHHVGGLGEVTSIGLRHIRIRPLALLQSSKGVDSSHWVSFPSRRDATTLHAEGIRSILLMA